jgi:hypothetical protein
MDAEWGQAPDLALYPRDEAPEAIELARGSVDELKSEGLHLHEGTGERGSLCGSRIRSRD